MFLHCVVSIESTELPTAGPTACSAAEYTQVHEVYKNCGPALYHPLSLSVFHALREYARKEAAQAGRPPVSGAADSPGGAAAPVGAGT